MKIAASLAVPAVIALSGCAGSQPSTWADGSPTPTARPSAGSTEEDVPMSTTPPPQPSGTTPRTGDPGTPGPTADPEYPRDLVGPPMTVTGTVTVEYGCVILDNGTQRWALLGDQADRVRAGSRVTVKGQRMKAPAGCRAYGALDVSSVSPTGGGRRR